MNRRLLCLVSWLWCSALPAADLEPADPRTAGVYARAEALLDTLMEEEDLAGAAMALVWPGQPVWSVARGDASLEDGAPFTNTTQTTQHELAQLFTAVAVMQLVQNGQVDLDAPFSRYIPDFQPFAGEYDAGFTVRQLLSHHAGLPSYHAPGSGFRGFRNNGDSEAWRAVLQHDDDLALVAAPGEVYDYSYLGYALLGLLIEAVSGETYTDYVTQHILAPLGLARTTFSADPDNVPGIARAYEDGEQVPHEQLRDLPSAGLVSSVADMGRFLQALLDGRNTLLDEESIASLFAVQDASAFDANFEMGLGFFVSPVTGGAFRALRSASHASTDGATRTYLLAFPDEGLGVVLTTNSQLSSVKLRDAADRVMEGMLEVASGYESDPYVPHAAVELDEGRASAVLGTFTGPGGIYRVERRGNELRLDVPMIPLLRVDLLPRADNYYGVAISLLGFNLGRFSQLQLLADSLEGRQQTVDGKRLWYWYWRGVAAVTLTEVPPAAADDTARQWRERTGDYESLVTQQPYQLEFDEDTGHFTFGRAARGMRLLRQAPELYCPDGASLLRTCARGLLGSGTRDVLRVTEDGVLLDAFGVRYAPR